MQPTEEADTAELLRGRLGRLEEQLRDHSDQLQAALAAVVERDRRLLLAEEDRHRSEVAGLKQASFPPPTGYPEWCC